MNQIITNNNKSYIKGTVHMLPNISMTCGCLGKIGDELVICDSQKKHLFNSKCKPQHLYITDNSDIKEGDWKLNTKLGTFWQHKREDKNLPNEIKNAVHPDTKKIIASTDTSLHFKAFVGKVPNSSFDKPSCARIPQSFLEFFVKEQGKISEVLIEVGVNDGASMIDISDDFPAPIEYYIKLKLNSGSLIIESIDLLKSKEQTIEEAGEQYAAECNPGRGIDNILKCDRDAATFVVGAKSQAAKEYWFSIFKQNLLI